jgi:PAS domain S-box-containing protein
LQTIRRDTCPFINLPEAANKDEIFSLACVKLEPIRLTPQSAKNEAAMKATATEAPERSIPAEDALRLVIDTTPTLIHTARPDGYIDYFNKAWLEFFGKSLEDVRGWRWTDSVHPEDVTGIIQKWQTSLESGEPFEAEARVRRCDGSYRAFLHRKAPLRDEHGTIVKWFGSSIDIEDRKRAENSPPLEAQLQATLNVIPAYTWYAVPSGTLIFVNERTADYLGLPKDHPLRLGIDTGAAWDSHIPFLHADDHQQARRVWSTCLRTGSAGEVTFRVRNAQGGYRWFLSRSEPLRTTDGTLRYWIGVNLDIEERKQAEFYLAEGERLAHMGSWSLTATGICDYWSRELYEINGFDPAKGVPTIPEFLTHVHPDDRERITNTIDQMMAKGLGADVKYRFVHPERGIRFVRGVGEPVYEEGLVTRFVGTTLDITEQEQLTQELQRQQAELERQQAYLAQAQALSCTGSFGWNVSTGDLYWSEETFEILEYKRTVKPTLELVFKRVHPGDVAAMQQTIERASQDAKDLDFEHRLLMPGGSIKHVHVLAQPFKDQSGNVEFVGAVMDVTASKKAFQEIKALKDELYKENIVLREEVDKTSMFEEVVVTSPVLQAVLARAAKVAPTDSTVLITGETGTGKELIARAIHKRSQRSARAFVSVNCAAIPQSLITSELFGHEKGAFTGATQRRLGRFELAEGGTLFLDEIGELPIETQIALLRVLQEREFERIGGTESLRADVRVIAATNRDLEAAIAAGTFRSDLFYRLNVFPIRLPPLRERKEDIQPLVSYFVDRFAKRAGRKISGIRKSALDSLQSYSWPGNIRELQNVIERSLIVCETDEFTIDKSWLSGGPAATRSADQALIETSAPGERELIEAALAQTKGKVSGLSGAAAKLGIPASTLESKIRSLKINKYRFKEH